MLQAVRKNLLVHSFMNNLIHIFYSFLAIVLFGVNSYAEVSVHYKYNGYQVAGNSLADIQKSIVNSEVRAEDGYAYTAKTTPKFIWKYNFLPANGMCSIKSVDVDVEISYYLPELSNINGLSGKDKKEWRRFYNAVYRHEKGHADLSINAAKELEWEATSVSPKPSCAEAARTANMLISFAMQRHDKEQIVYDSRTNHGTSQYAVLNVR